MCCKAVPLIYHTILQNLVECVTSLLDSNQCFGNSTQNSDKIWNIVLLQKQITCYRNLLLYKMYPPLILLYKQKHILALKVCFKRFKLQNCWWIIFKLAVCGMHLGWFKIIIIHCYISCAVYFSLIV